MKTPQSKQERDAYINLMAEIVRPTFAPTLSKTLASIDLRLSRVRLLLCKAITWLDS